MLFNNNNVLISNTPSSGYLFILVFEFQIFTRFRIVSLYYFILFIITIKFICRNSALNEYEIESLSGILSRGIPKEKK